MIARLYGKCNGQNVVFQPNERGRWEITVPRSPDKKYIIELWAEDLAGNIGYYATVEAYYDSEMLEMRFRLIDIGPLFREIDINSMFRNIEIDSALETIEVEPRFRDNEIQRWRA